jgi:signal transduction histidine kinase
MPRRDLPCAEAACDGAEPAILVVDDRPANLVAFEATLAPLGQPIVTAATGEQALQLLPRGDYALILIDVQMPGMGGFELATLIQADARFASIPIIFVTALHHDTTHVFSGYAHGAVDYLLKPFEPEMLRAKVRVFSELYRAHRTVRLQAQLLHEHQLGEIERRNEERFRGLTRARLLEREHLAREEAEAANRMKDQFLATVSHELRTPLNAILGWTQVMRTGVLQGERLSKAIDTIERNARTQARLVNELLDISRIASGKLVLELGPCVLDEIVAEVLESIRHKAEAKRVAIRREAGAPPISIVGDAARLRQVLSNLLLNAVKFTPVEGRVDIRASAHDGYARVVFEDTGEGIEPAFLPFVFDRFRQGRPDAHASGGLGIGLSIARHLVELHGGRLVAESEGPGRGARFTVSVPVAGPRPAATSA